MRALLALLIVLLPVAVFAEAQPLSIEKIDVHVQIDGRLARTKVSHVFHNNSLRRIGAHFRLRLPDEAAVTRLAMSVSGELIEGEVVPRARAREIYDGIVRAQRDPALLEWQAPGEYTLDIFPIEGGESKVVVLEYSELLEVEAGVAQYRFRPLEGERDVIERYEVDIVTEERVTADAPLKRVRKGHVRYRGRHVGHDAIRADIALDEAPRVWTNAGHFVADLPVEVPLEAPQHRHIVVAIDSSASGTAGLQTARDVALALNAQPHRALRVVWGSTQTHRCDEGLVACLDGIERRGATDLSALVRAAADEARALGGATDIVLISDGRITHGATRAFDITHPVRDIEGTALHVVASGGDPALGRLDLLAEHGRGYVIDPSGPGFVMRLAEARTKARLWAVEVRGATSAAAPVEHRFVGAGTHVAVFGRTGDRNIELTVVRGDERIALPFAGAKSQRAPDVSALWARAALRRLEQRRGMKKQLETFSRNHGVLSAATSFLVLENQQAFERFDIHRRQHRKLARRRETAAPMVRISKIIVNGSLDKDIIARPVRARSDVFRGCYEDALRADPGLAGTVVVEFAIGETGRVLRARIDRDELDNGVIEDCLLEEVRTMRFPPVADAGLVTVRYPLSFASAKTGAPRGPAAVSYEVARLLRDDEPARAQALLHRNTAKYRTDHATQATLALRLYAAQSVREAYPDAFRDAALRRLRYATPPPGLLTRVTDLLLRERRVSELLGLPRPSPRVVRSLLEQSVRHVSVEQLRALYAHWMKRASPAAQVAAIVGHPVLEAALASELTVAVMAAPDPDETALDALARVATVTKWKREAAKFVVAQCAAAPPSTSCVDRLRMLRGVAGVRSALKRQHARRVSQLEQQRLEQPADADELAELSELLAEAGQRERAVDIAMEIVEYAPDSDDARERAFQLIESFPPGN